MEHTAQPQQRTENVRPALYNGFACIDDLKDRGWSSMVSDLSSMSLGGLGIDGWRVHWSRIYEFPWAYGAILSCTALKAGQEVLESGCGVTPLPFWLAAGGFHVTGVDLDRSCEPKWRSDGVPCRPDPSLTRFECGDMLDLPRRDESVDVVYSVSAVEHTSNRVKAVAEMLRILKRGGLLVLTLDADICNTALVSWPELFQIQRLLETATTPALPCRHVVPSRLLTFENRTITPQSANRLFLKRALDHVGWKPRYDQTIFAWAGRKL